MKVDLKKNKPIYSPLPSLLPTHRGKFICNYWCKLLLWFWTNYCTSNHTFSFENWSSDILCSAQQEEVNDEALPALVFMKSIKSRGTESEAHSEGLQCFSSHTYVFHICLDGLLWLAIGTQNTNAHTTGSKRICHLCLGHHKQLINFMMI